ncbi:MAG: hypothetical protein QHH24_03820 [Candidatus Bathyarchaeota archaeon]|nr:hypothetical protein [Candidatus Bathyarchaeota archaeon]
MLGDSNGKLLIYVSSFASREKRLKPVSLAAEKVAKLMKLKVDVVTFRKKFRSIYVYYKSGEEDPVPLYCNNEERSNIDDVYEALRKMMFVLSFHPKYTALKSLRREVMLFS